MEHIQLLTMDSYLEAKKEVVENAGYRLKELHIDRTKRIEEIIEEIYEEYFEKKTIANKKNLYM